MTMLAAAAARQSLSSAPTQPASSSRPILERRIDNNVPVTRNTSRRIHRRRKRVVWIPTTTGGNVLYRPQSAASRTSDLPAAPAFPAPLIGPRRTRPHTIHVVSLPPGYNPRELRIQAASVQSSTGSATPYGRSKGLPDLSRCFRPDLPVRLLLKRLKLLSSFSGQSLSAADLADTLIPASLQAFAASEHNSLFPIGPPCAATAQGSDNHRRRRRQFIPSSNTPHRNRHIDELFHRDYRGERPEEFEGNREQATGRLRLRAKTSDRDGERERAREQTRDGERDRGRIRVNKAQIGAGVGGNAEKNSDLDRERQRGRGSTRPGNRHAPWTGNRPPQDPRPPPMKRSRQHPQALSQNDNEMTLAGRRSPTYHFGSPRQSFASVRRSKSPITNVTEVPKPVASGHGVACSIILAERQLFLSGFDHDGRGRPEVQPGTALLRGRLQLIVSKNVKIRAIQLKLVGRARTEWPEGIPPLKQDTFEENSLRTQVLTFFNALSSEWETEFGNQCTFRLPRSSENSSCTNLQAGRHHLHNPLSLHSRGLTAKELRLLSLRNVRARSLGRGDSRGLMCAAPAKGYKTFTPGTYDYSFELPIDHHQLETTKVPYGSVKWELHAAVDRAGAFKPNLHGIKELPIVRLPDQLSLEMSEPISISRRWEDQLHYDIMVSGKSFPIGSKIPIAFKLTPLAKVRVHKIKVYITELIEYWTNDRRVTRKDPGRKVLLLERNAGKELDPAWAPSDMVTTRGGELTPEQRRDYRDQASRRRARESRRTHRLAEPLPAPSDNILGDLELGLESLWGATEIEANVQIPTCEMMAKNKNSRLHPDCSWRNINVFHWIKIVMRISRVDADDPSGTKRRHFEISIDSPLTILDCRATQANTILPAYSHPTSIPGPAQSGCGCADASHVQTEALPRGSMGEPVGTSNHPDGSVPTAPRAAQLLNRLPQATSPIAAEGLPRPMHLLRVPSYNPPAFDDDVAPPLLVDDTGPSVMTPPPRYDVVIGNPSVDGMADYFSRLADYEYENEEDSEDSEDDRQRRPRRLTERSGRVNVAHPRTPGGHRYPSRSVELTRTSTDLGLGGLHISRGSFTRTRRDVQS